MRSNNALGAEKKLSEGSICLSVNTFVVSKTKTIVPSFATNDLQELKMKSIKPIVEDFPELSAPCH